MELIKKLALILIVAVLLISIYYIFFNSEDKDTEDPIIDTIAGNTTGIAGEIVIISVTFSDNIGVTNATIYHRIEGDNDWNSKSILNGSINFSLPTDSEEDWHYYITIDDDAKNGPVGDPSVNGSVYYTITVNRNDDNDNGDDDDDDITVSHAVFIEESTAQDCKFCPSVAEKIHELYESGKYNFYYVSLIEDDQKAKNRLKTHYNHYANPTVYFDGGYEVILGNKSKDEYESKIQKSLSRSVENIDVNIRARFDEKSSIINITTTLINHEKTDYNGNLKIYLTEIISTKWHDYNGDSYHNAFLDFAQDEIIIIPAENQIIISKDINASEEDLDPENLLIFSVVFNNEKHQGYSNPSSSGNPFDAYYSDAVNSTYVVDEGNLPPNVGITHPKRGKLHIFGKEILTSLTLKKTILIGKTTITVQASDEDSNISRVEFYLDDQLVSNFTVPPYEWKWKNQTMLKFKHTLEIVAFDEEGKSSTDTMEVIAFIFSN